MSRWQHFFVPSSLITSPVSHWMINGLCEVCEFVLFRLALAECVVVVNIHFRVIPVLGWHLYEDCTEAVFFCVYEKGPFNLSRYPVRVCSFYFVICVLLLCSFCTVLSFLCNCILCCFGTAKLIEDCWHCCVAGLTKGSRLILSTTSARHWTANLCMKTQLINTASYQPSTPSPASRLFLKAGLNVWNVAAFCCQNFLLCTCKLGICKLVSG